MAISAKQRAASLAAAKKAQAFVKASASQPTLTSKLQTLAAQGRADTEANISAIKAASAGLPQAAIDARKAAIGDTGDTGGTGGTGGTGSSSIIPTSIDGTDANSILASGLKMWGLSDLGPMVSKLINQGINIAGIADQIRGTPSYAARFPAIKALNAKGEGISEAEYIAKENSDRAMLFQYLGPTAQAYDNPAQLGTLMTNFVSTNELQLRLQNIHDAVNSSADTKSWLKANYGYSDQDLAAAWLNPQLTSDAITRRESASQIGGAGLASGFGNLSQTQAEALANQGVTQGQAQSVFGKIGNMGQLQSGLPGNETGSLTQQQLLDAGFTDGAPREKLAQLQSARVAQFQQSGGVIADSSGVVGGRVAAF
jgi:hypothetical protein